MIAFLPQYTYGHRKLYRQISKVSQVKYFRFSSSSLKILEVFKTNIAPDNKGRLEMTCNSDTEKNASVVSPANLTTQTFKWKFQVLVYKIQRNRQKKQETSVACYIPTKNSANDNNFHCMCNKANKITKQQAWLEDKIENTSSNKQELTRWSEMLLLGRKYWQYNLPFLYVLYIKSGNRPTSVDIESASFCLHQWHLELVTLYVK